MKRQNIWNMMGIITVSLCISTLGYAKTVEERLVDLEQKLLAETASTSTRVETLIRDLQGVQGGVETNQHVIEGQQKETGRLYLDLDHRLQALEERIKILSDQMTKALSKIAPQIADEGKFYQKGLDEIHGGNYMEAAAHFGSFLKKYPKSDMAPLAQFWIGESYFSLRDLQQAIKEYQKVIEKYPRHEKTKIAILRQGESFAELGMKDEAKVFFDKVATTYPGTDEAKKATEKKVQLETRKAVGSGTPGSGSSLGGYPEKTVQEELQSKKQPPSSTPSTQPPEKIKEPAAPLEF